ncbi:GTPase-activating protein skywalker isoform X2 [Nematostella vectensis]|uniref:GTPase-activating protein skywalker isoform X2 n=1 Tax=Nematostella vectensis TaxID=45351 RepID=UPI00207720DA|nr:GTPase-activating protein skywalker isoform X2 [Nematostella vectensis]
MDPWDFVELSEVQGHFFTDFVLPEKATQTKVFDLSYTDENLDKLVGQWLEHPSRKNTDKVIKLVKGGVRPDHRAILWKLVSGGIEKLETNENYYQDTVNELGILIPGSLSSSMFTGSDNKLCCFFLGQDGEKAMLGIVYVLTHVHSDIQFCPLLPVLAALFLHFMDERECFASLSALMESRHGILDQSQRAVAVTSKTFEDCLKKFKVSMMDVFLMKGSKVLIRFGLVIYDEFSRWLVAKQDMNGISIKDAFKQFVKENPMESQALLEAAFKIRRLSRRRVTKLNNKNLVLIESGMLEVPYQREKPLHETTVMALQGTDMLTDKQWERLANWLPDRARIKRPVCVFTTEKYGYSLRTFYQRCQEEEETILLIKTTTGDIFGAFCTSPWLERLEGPKDLTYFGTGESFVFTLSPEATKYDWSGIEQNQESKDYFMAGNDNCLLIGGGGENSIWINGDFSHGRSGRSQTYDNEPLTAQKDFVCTRLECITFLI